MEKKAVLAWLLVVSGFFCARWFSNSWMIPQTTLPTGAMSSALFSWGALLCIMFCLAASYIFYSLRAELPSNALYGYTAILFVVWNSVVVILITFLMLLFQWIYPLNSMADAERFAAVVSVALPIVAGIAIMLLCCLALPYVRTHFKGANVTKPSLLLFAAYGFVGLLLFHLFQSGEVAGTSYILLQLLPVIGALFGYLLMLSKVARQSMHDVFFFAVKTICLIIIVGIGYSIITTILDFISII